MSEDEPLLSELMLPLHKSIATVARQINRERSKQTRSIRNRLHSIAADATFVTETAAHLNLPVIANERCGSWYVPLSSPVALQSTLATPAAVDTPDVSYGRHVAAANRALFDAQTTPVSAYFKSTDGHYGQWGFSLRRLNVAVLDVVGSAGGCIIVDSTRRGKQMPDALSKTIPIWCAVMNRLLFPEHCAFHGFMYNNKVVSESEASQVEKRLESFAAQAQSLNLDLNALRKKVKKPMRPVWIARSLGLTAETVISPEEVSQDQCFPVYLCMASLYQADSIVQCLGFEYVQGAGDDAESWSGGLQASVFWLNKDILLEANEEELPALVTSLFDRAPAIKQADSFTPIEPGQLVHVGIVDDAVMATVPGDAIIVCCPSLPSIKDKQTLSRVLHMKCGTGKVGSRDLRKELAKMPPFFDLNNCKRIMVCCTTGKDISIGVALAILVLWTDGQGNRLTKPITNETQIDKMLIRERLSWITTSVPTARPSRATLNAVNSFLMKEPH